MSSRLDHYRTLLQDFPLRLRANKSKGRYITATQTLEPGDLLLEEVPSAFTVFKQFAPDFCQCCLEPIQTTKTQTMFGSKKSSGGVGCLDCRNQSFWCSEQCKERDEIHKIGCRFLIELPGISGAASVDYNLLRLMLNLLIRKHLESREDVSGTPFSCVADLVSHFKSFPEKFLNSVQLASIDLISIFKDSDLDFVTTDELVKLACRINSNSHAIHDPSGGVNATIGVGLFPLVAMLNHSCTPNASFVSSKEGKMQVRAIKKIEQGQEVCVSYVDLFSPKLERQGSLLSSKFFWCECSRCKPTDSSGIDPDEWLDAVRCPKCETGFIVKSKMNCSECQSEISTAEMQEILSRVDLQNGMDLYKAGMFDSALIEINKIVDIGNRILHHHHYMFLNANVNLVSLYSRVNKFAEASTACARAIEQMISITKDANMGMYNTELANLCEKHGELLEILSEAVKEGLIDSPFSPKDLQELSQTQYKQCTVIRKVLYGI